MAQPLYTTSINKRTVFVSQGGRADLVFFLPLQDMYKVKDEDRSSKNINEEEKKPTGYGNTPTQYSQSTVQRWGFAEPQQLPLGCYSSGSPSAERGRASPPLADTAAQSLQGNTEKQTHWLESVARKIG